MRKNAAANAVAHAYKAYEGYRPILPRKERP
jgi:hypothetical protein